MKEKFLLQNYFRMFSVYKNIFTTKKRITVISFQHTTLLVLLGSSIQ